jgi:hypothetical protein
MGDDCEASFVACWAFCTAALPCASVARGDCVRAEYFRNNEKSIEIREEAIGKQQSAISNQVGGGNIGASVSFV